ncbi:MAG: hypothetical protein PHX78_05670 [bacterium]|nr:hypothetical protein [bacterium]
MKKNTVILIVVYLVLIFSSIQLLIQKSQTAAIIPEKADERIRYFYRDLDPYGEWIFHDTYNWTWRPYDMPIDWRPYTNGHWLYTDDGWVWVSDYSWGWACFHYGRWFYDDYYGWLWYPDTMWAPNWVVWRTGGDWIGWAPLPPRAFWREGIGLEFSDHDADDLPRHSFIFVRKKDFTDADIAHKIIEPARNITIFKQTNIVRNSIKIINNRAVNHFPLEEDITKSVGHPVNHYKISEENSLINYGVKGNELHIFKPENKKESVRSEQPLNLQNEPPELKNRHESEMRALEEIQQNRERQLKEDHERELQNPARNINNEELKNQHNREFNAFQEDKSRERNLLQNWHEREIKSYTAPNAPVQRPFNISPQKEYEHRR